MKSDLEKRFENILEEEKPVSGIYNKPFIVGVLFTIAVFIISNLISYLVSYSPNNEKNIFGSYDYFMWGFPFAFCNSRFDCYPIDLCLNIIVLAFFSFVFGFSFRFVWSKISYRFVKVK